MVYVSQRNSIFYTSSDLNLLVRKMMDFCFPSSSSSSGQVYENESVAVAQCRQVSV